MKEYTPPVLLEPEGVLMRILKVHAEKGRRKPKMFPGTVRDAAMFWIAHQEPPNDLTEPVTENWVNDQLIGYNTPFHDRLSYTLRQFLKLNDLYQTLVIEAAERGIYWRGEGMNIFPTIVRESDEMKKDPEAYKAKHSATIQKMGVRA